MTFVNKRHLIIAGVICLLGYPQQVVSGSSLASRFSCININGTPASVVETKTGKQVPIIFWKSQTFSGSGWTPDRRCQEVSARFQSYHSSGTLEYITTGRINGLPVICVAQTDGGACAGAIHAEAWSERHSYVEEALRRAYQACAAPSKRRLHVCIECGLDNPE